MVVRQIYAAPCRQLQLELFKQPSNFHVFSIALLDLSRVKCRQRNLVDLLVQEWRM